MSTVAQFTPTNQRLAVVMAQALAAYPADEARIQRGAEIVERGGVRINANGTYLIGIYHTFPVSERCPCPDMIYRSSPCKHKWAKALYKKMQAAPVRSLQFYATLRGVGGVATAYETGQAFFQADEEERPVACSEYEIVYELVFGGRVDIATAA